VGCGDDASTGSGERSGSPALDAGTDASLGRLKTVPIIDAGFVNRDAGEPSCGVNVGLSCDGDEDCSGGQVCCGTYDSMRFTYTSIECADSCDGTTQRKLSHPGDICPDATHVCRRSELIPFDFVSVCSTPDMSTAEQSGSAVEGEIACGQQSCVAGAEQCCLGALIALGSPPSITPLAPYCTVVGAA